MRIRILGRTWNFKFVPPEEIGGKNGSCDNPCRSNKSIELWDELQGEECLETIIHECLHAAGWDVFDEKFCETFAIDVARAAFTKEALKRILDDPKVKEVLCELGYEVKGDEPSEDVSSRQTVRRGKDQQVAEGAIT